MLESLYLQPFVDPLVDPSVKYATVRDDRLRGVTYSAGSIVNPVGMLPGRLKTLYELRRVRRAMNPTPEDVHVPVSAVSAVSAAPIRPPMAKGKR